MDRRTFLKAASSFALLLPLTGKKAFAQSYEPYPGPFLLCIHAGGGWDTTMSFDPKPPYEDEKGEKIINNTYTTTETFGPFSYAPIQYHLTANNPATPWLHDPRTFLINNDRPSMLLINGVDTQTNAHPVGEQVVWSGHVGRDYPSLAALLAIKASRDFEKIPCAYFANNGGYVRTLGRVPLSQVNSAARIRELANQERLPAVNETLNLFSEQTSRRIQQANEKRIQQLSQELRLPESTAALGHYDKAMLTRHGLAPLIDPVAGGLPATAVTSVSRRSQLAGTTSATAIDTELQQVQMALHGFNTGTMASASITLGGFDSHSNNDNVQRPRMGYLLILLDYILEEARRLGLLDRLTLVVGSEFSRTPTYNNNNLGKDHWNTTSYLLFGPHIRGDRVLGATTRNQYPEYINPQNPSQLLPKDAGGIALRPSHVHHALRRALGLAEFNVPYEFLEGDIQLF